VVTGHARDEIGFLVIPDQDACRALSGLPEGTPLPAVLTHARIRSCVARGLAALAKSGGGSSTHATRALFLTEPLSIDAGELTDKGYVNQGAVLARRAALVDKLYGTPPDASVITL